MTARPHGSVAFGGTGNKYIINLGLTYIVSSAAYSFSTKTTDERLMIDLTCLKKTSVFP